MIIYLYIYIHTYTRKRTQEGNKKRGTGREEEKALSRLCLCARRSLRRQSALPVHAVVIVVTIARARHTPRFWN